MRPLRLDLHGFTVFREPTTVDLTDADYFVLVGPTGSGKSTVLDAICFALYGTVPRWGDRRRIENALAPSSTEARVRLVFESGGARFVATRVVRRDARGNVATSQAGLEQLPAGFDVRVFDEAPAERQTGLGTVLAGTASEMEAAVLAAVGLPYEQFTSCVVLPQGQFARFLHAKRAERQEILINLLGLHVYDDVRELAKRDQQRAEAAAMAARGLLGDLGEADDEALKTATETLAAMQSLAGQVDIRLPTLDSARLAVVAAEAELTALDEQIAALRAVRAPAGAATTAATLAAARLAAADAARAVTAAEEHEEKLRAELAGSGDRAGTQRLLDAYGRRLKLVAQAADIAKLLDRARTEHDAAAADLTAAHLAAEAGAAALVEARRATEAAQTADRAASLRPHLVAGEPCPVCTQPVLAVPDMPEAPVLRAARDAQARAEKQAEALTAHAQSQERAVRALERELDRAAAQHEQLATTIDAVAAELADAPPEAALRATLETIERLDRQLAGASTTLRSARLTARAAAADAAGAEQRLHAAWRTFDEVRDGLVGYGPPTPDRNDLSVSWQALTYWASGQVGERAGARTRAAEAVEEADRAVDEAHGAIVTVFADAGVDLPGAGRGGPDAAHYRQAAALAVQRAQTAHALVVQRREQGARLIEQIAGNDREAQVARMLTMQLQADRFKQWLLAEALTTLVDGASRILRELSGGQYDLAQEKGDFVVVDHGDAGLRRGVRTLSGGETFQASLALALALSEQLAGMSTASANLESIMLDEGFGTLDAATLDTVAATLENLAARGDRMVGVVTHVGALAERIPVRFEVHRDARGIARVERTG